ncbi:YoaK family protein [Sphingosinithalassobacter sp. LHW66-3]|uniref:YoaK family protein n=1 Tax=Sphingosinithalassobacter sp. LHW66-3 TaxID=3424718 RepID=UPI003D6B795A
MQRTDPQFVALAIALAALAGFVDALAYTTLGGFFASFMSGNSTRLGVGLGSGVTTDAVTAGALILSFVAGVIVASVLVRAFARHAMSAVMAAVTLLLLLAALLALVMPGPLVLLLLAAAMGAENGVFNREGEVSLGLTYMTGTLVRMGQKLAMALMGDKDRWGWIPWLLLWTGFTSGVVAGAVLHDDYAWHALWFAVGAAALLTVIVYGITRPAKAAREAFHETGPDGSSDVA